MFCQIDPHSSNLIPDFPSRFRLEMRKSILALRCLRATPASSRGSRFHPFRARIRCAPGHAAIAYELSSAYWGRGLARQAVQAMISELVEHYQVRCLSAVLKRGNLRSMRLLERLGFSLASPERHAKQQVEPGEILMRRDIQGK